jgi:nicotinate-nucleotide adenylyltransferase
MPTLCFGGSFNPIHHGHLIGARAVAEKLSISRVTLVPTGQPPHKPVSPDLASAADRSRMCRLAVGQGTHFEVNDIELELGGPSYTIDTVRELRRRGLDHVQWLIGADMLMYLPHWHRAEELIREVEFVIMARPGWELDWNTLPAEFRRLRDKVVPAPMIDISSTNIRRRVAAGASVDYLTPAAVCDYIRDRGLYR